MHAELRITNDYPHCVIRLMQERREGTKEEGEGGEEGPWLPCGVRDQERGRPPRRWLPLAQVWPEGRQEQLLPKVLPPLHSPLCVCVSKEKKNMPSTFQFCSCSELATSV